MDGKIPGTQNLRSKAAANNKEMAVRRSIGRGGMVPDESSYAAGSGEAVISPLSAEICLHYVLDLWINQWRKRKAHCDVLIVSYADDSIMGFQYRSEAEQFNKELKERLQEFQLKSNVNKIRLIEYGRFAARDRNRRRERKPETFRKVDTGSSDNLPIPNIKTSCLTQGRSRMG